MERRHVVSGGLVAGLTALVASGAAEAASQRSETGDELVAGAVNELRHSVERQFDRQLVPWQGVARVREQQRIFLKAGQKFPDFIEIGLEVWESVYDWHVRHLQPVTMSRAADGRYTMVFMFTTLLLRPDLDGNYVGYGFDNERRP